MPAGRPDAPVSVDRSDSDPAAAYDAAGHDVLPLLSCTCRRFHAAPAAVAAGPAADGRWRVGVVPPQRQRRNANADERVDVRADADADDGNRWAAAPWVVAVAVPVAAAAVAVPAAAGRGHGPGPPGPVWWAAMTKRLRRRRRRRLATIFSKSHWLPKFCIVCLGLHIYRYWDLKCTHN